jgi:hypothetical protein
MIARQAAREGRLDVVPLRELAAFDDLAAGENLGARGGQPRDDVAEAIDGTGADDRTERRIAARGVAGLHPLRSFDQQPGEPLLHRALDVDP